MILTLNADNACIGSYNYITIVSTVYESYSGGDSNDDNHAGAAILVSVDIKTYFVLLLMAFLTRLSYFVAAQCASHPRIRLRRILCFLCGEMVRKDHFYDF